MKYGYITKTEEVPIDPGEGWELVPYDPATVIQDDWNFCGDDGRWRGTNNGGVPMGKMRLGDPDIGVRAYRRRKPEPPKPFLDVEKVIAHVESVSNDPWAIVTTICDAINEAMAERDKKHE